MISMALIWMPSISFAVAVPMGRNQKMTAVAKREPSVYTDSTYGTSTQGRLAYGLVLFVCLFALAFTLGVRVSRFQRNKVDFAWFLVHLQTLVALGLIVSSSILIVTLGMTSWEQCYSAIMVCIVFYTSSKLCLYMFLLERAHVVRAPFLRKRTDDRVWVGGTILLCVFFGAITAWSLAEPYANLNPVDGQCRIGIAKVPGYLIFIFDAIINFLLTIIFIVLLWPVLEFRKKTACNRHAELRELNRVRKALRNINVLGFGNEPRADRFLLSIKKVLWKNAIGSVLTFAASAANIIVFFSEHGRQVAFVCFSTCMADVTFSVLVVHWLTLGSIPERENNNRPHRTHTPSFASSSTAVSVSKSEETTKPEDVKP